MISGLSSRSRITPLGLRLTMEAKRTAPPRVSRMGEYSATPKTRIKNVVILQDVADVTKTRAWLGSDDLKTEMQKNVSASRPLIKPSPAVRKARR
jgi:hypothetical protein